MSLKIGTLTEDSNDLGVVTMGIFKVVAKSGCDRPKILIVSGTGVSVTEIIG